MNGAQIVYDIFYLVIFNIVVAGMEFNFFLRFSEHKQKSCTLYLLYQPDTFSKCT